MESEEESEDLLLLGDDDYSTDPETEETLTPLTAKQFGEAERVEGLRCKTDSTNLEVVFGRTMAQLRAIRAPSPPGAPINEPDQVGFFFLPIFSFQFSCF